MDITFALVLLFAVLGIVNGVIAGLFEKHGSIDWTAQLFIALAVICGAGILLVLLGHAIAHSH